MATTETDELVLVGEKVPLPKYRKVSLDELASNEDLVSPEPSADMVRSVRLIGVMEPIILEESKKGFDVVSGRRRIKAARAVELKQIGAMVYPAGSGMLHVGAISENEIRSANDVTSFLAIEALMAQHKVQHPDEIARALGVNPKRAKKLMRLAGLVPGLLAAFKEGRIAPSAAFQAVKLPPTVQAGLVRKLKKDDDGRLTIEQVREARQVHVQKEMAQIGDDAFGTPSAAEAGAAPAFPLKNKRLEFARMEEIEFQAREGARQAGIDGATLVDKYGRKWVLDVVVRLVPAGALDGADDEVVSRETEEE